MIDRRLKWHRILSAFSLLLASVATGSAQNKVPVTETHYLSGHGADDMVQWDFFCTEGRNSGKWTKIGVPSCWELQGFGQYQYGISFYGKPFPEGIANEKGMYKYEFDVPQQWRGSQIELVFEASMTDTEVKVNGRKAGSKHQGAFYRFSYNVTDMLKYGKKNLLEVTVSKESENAGVNLAERRADYWNFGGVFRPVFLEIKPALNIQRTAIDAKADGSFIANCYLNSAADNVKLRTVILDKNGKKVSETVTPVKAGSDWTTVRISVSNPLLWTAETPDRYKAEFSLLAQDGSILHRETESFGFRTIEVKESDGLYINGVRVNIRGVNRHSFRPETGRTLSKAKNLEDVLLIKSMNMNSVRLSHYPADPDFLDACDSLGLYVMSELGGWHGKYDTPTGIVLIKSMVERDVNHPSIIWWSNGNEKGWNTELDCEFHKHDPQARPVIHPQGNFSGFETMHYRSYGESQEYMRLPQIFMPTEFLHGLYDGGHGAGLWDYWEMMRKHPRCIGGFLWVLADEGVKRVDMNGFIDNQGNFGADGIVEPHHEKEGSYYTIKQIWNPIQVMNKQLTKAFNGVLQIENRYDFLNLNTCTFNWKYVTFPLATDVKKEVKVLKQGETKGENITAHQAGTMKIAAAVKDADALILTAVDAFGKELFTWSYTLGDITTAKELTVNGAKPTYTETAEAVIAKAGGREFTFCKRDGQLKAVKVSDKLISFANGPRFIGARRADRSLDQFYNHDDENAKQKDRTYTEFDDATVFTGFDIKEAEGKLLVTANYKLGNFDKAQWSISADGTLALDYTYNFSGVVDLMGIRFDYPEDKVLSKQWLGDGPYRVWQNRLHGPQYNLWENDYNDPVPGESFTYPEFKGYFAHVSWMNIRTKEGEISITNETPDTYVGVYQPRDGRDRLLYTLPESGISLLNVIPAVRNKVNSTDLCGPSSQPKWVSGQQHGRIVFRFNGIK
ncbi:MAG: lacZ 5 [Bacteroidetes bacterium]|nr:lacZ 5 [Bacteroidota bacterium]